MVSDSWFLRGLSAFLIGNFSGGFKPSPSAVAHETRPKKKMFGVGLPEAGDASFLIAGFSRPCCSFLPGWITNTAGISGFIEPTGLGQHDFGRFGSRGLREIADKDSFKMADEKVGLVYTCDAGFIDISHLRDNADWAAHLLGVVHAKIGSGETFEIRNEGGSLERRLVFPKVEPKVLASLTDADYSNLAIATVYDISIFHEIVSSFYVAVSTPRIPILFTHIITERNSAFSPEDGYSNLLGATLGARVAQVRGETFNERMTVEIDNVLKELRVIDRPGALSVLKSVKGPWWKKKRLSVKSFKEVRKRNYDIAEWVTPLIPETDRTFEVCGSAAAGLPVLSALPLPKETRALRIPLKDLARAEMVPSAALGRQLKRRGIEVGDTISSSDFQEIVPEIQIWFEQKLGQFSDLP